MVKRQKEKQYQSAREQRALGQSRAGTGPDSKGGTVQRILPFHCCALTLTPFEIPVCTTSSKGVVFDNAALMEFVLRYRCDPVTGEPLSSTGNNNNGNGTNHRIIRLHMDKDEEGRWQCPVLTKPFADHTKIVAVIDRSGKDGNNLEAYVYSYEAYQELNIKPKNWRDLTTGHKFHPQKDVLILNDPNDDDLQRRRDIRTFWHIQNARGMDAAKLSAPGTASGSNNGDIRQSVTSSRIMEQIERERQAKRTAEADRIRKAAAISGDASEESSTGTNKRLKIYSHDVTGVKYTSGKAAGSFTSTAMDVSNDNTVREASAEEILQAQFRVMRTQKEQKGYVRIITNLGDLLVELHCNIVPRTCANFLGLCRQGRYDGSSFHRLIPTFMVQGGKNPIPSQVDSSFWGDTDGFVDEFDDRLKHSGEGILSMANAGPGTNKQQFFITFKECPHLDRKHSVFGEVVDGMSVLGKMKEIAADKKDRPTKPIQIIRTEILVDPAKEAQDSEETRLTAIAKERDQQSSKYAKTEILVPGASAAAHSVATKSTSSSRIGKYLPATIFPASHSTSKKDDDDTVVPTAPAHAVGSYGKPSAASNKKITSKFGDFSAW